MGFVVECVKVDATVEIPDRRRGFTALPSEDWEVLAVLIEAFRYSHFCFDAVDSIF